jgi:hypothetical protein
VAVGGCTRALVDTMGRDPVKTYGPDLSVCLNMFTNAALVDLHLDAMWTSLYFKHHSGRHNHVPAPGLVATTTTRAHRAFMS